MFDETTDNGAHCLPAAVEVIDGPLPLGVQECKLPELSAEVQADLIDTIEIIPAKGRNENRIMELQTEESRLEREWISAILNDNRDRASASRKDYNKTVEELSFLCRRQGLIR